RRPIRSPPEIFHSRHLTKISFGILLADYASNPIDLCSVSVTSLAALVNVYRVRRHYVLLDLTGDGVDTVGVCGSNPHAPTRSFSITDATPSFRCSVNTMKHIRMLALVFLPLVVFG